MKKAMVLSMTVCLLASQGCDNSGLDSRQLALRTSSISGELASQVEEAIRFVEELESMLAAENGFEILNHMFYGIEEAGPAPDPRPAPDRNGDDDVAAEIEAFLDEYIFNPVNLESEEPD